MTRLPLKITGVLTGAILVSGMATGIASAADQKLDGSITASGSTCSWTNASISANPPSTLTLDRTTVNPPGGNLSCSGSVTVSLNNNPTISFNDTAGTATADLISVTVQTLGVSCQYSANGLTAQRQGTTRNYSASGVTISKSGGSFLCPGSATADATFNFH
ncbi:hypothetical protein ORV05_19620 [Amycolatopsis cynarae]|uniref:Secreted protein n=1 Tax=Amycolatopsis cynarae TaxID=2995223 RepID=A0ABY7AW23_9PSEU|nr:hypothetical protein [Amycolatopsis sp. HUAS 11-8]WAL63238.1 hypothetical protein ORV05_19620 [Amycolatopsis sp. HUAS 11-8]